MKGIDDFDLGQITSTAIDTDGFVSAGFDWIGDNNTGGAQPAELLHPLGFLSVPSDPTVGASPDGGTTPSAISAACVALKMWEGDRCFGLAMADPRAMANLPNWNKGDGGFYAPSGYGNFFRCRADGRLELSTRTDDGNNADVYMLIDPTAATSTKPTGPGFYRVAPWGTETFNASGWHVSTQWGACVDVGGFSGDPALDKLGMTSTISFRASQISANAAIVKLGSGAGHSQVTLAVPLALTLTSILQGMLGILTTLTTAVAPTSGGPLTFVPPTAPATLVTQIQALITALSGSAPIPFAANTTFAL